MSPHQISGQLRDVTDLTRRDTVLAFLLAVDALLHPSPFDAAAVRNGSKPLNDTESAQVLFHVIQQSLGLVAADPEAFVHELGYGLPAWLIADQGDAPLDVMWDRLTTERGQVWVDLAADLQRSDYLRELDQLSSALRLREQAAAPPAQAVRDLPNWVLAENNGPLRSIKTGLAARAAQRGMIETERLARQALAIARAYDDPRIEELAWRLIRFDFPVVVTRKEKRGILLGAELGFGRTDGPRVTVRNAEEIQELLVPGDIRKRWTWQPCDGAFLRGVRQGTKAAITLLSELRHPKEEIAQFEAPQIYLRGLLPPTEVTGGSIGLPLALEILRRALDLPVSEWTASGEIEENGEIPPLEPDDLLAKWQAVSSDGIKKGLLAAAAVSKEKQDRLLVLGPKHNTLRHAAAALWGNEWHHKIDEMRSRDLHALGFVPEYRQEEPVDAAMIGGTAIIVDTLEAHEIVKFFQSHDDEFAFLGGAPKSGKTWMARQVQKTMEDLGTWRVDIVSVDPLKQPTTDDVIEAIKIYNTASSQPRRLVIVDGLEWNEGLVDFEHAMQNVARRGRISLLAVARSVETEGGRWQTDDCMTFRPIQGEEAVGDLLKAVLEQFPALGSAEPLVGAIRQYARQDLWWMMHLLALAAETGVSSYPQLVRKFFESRVASTSPADLETLKKVATLSLCSACVPKDLVAPALERPLQAIGARFVSNQGWMIPSRATAAALLSLEVQKGVLTLASGDIDRPSVPGLSAVLIESVLGNAIARDDSAAVLIILSRLRRNRPATLSKVWRLMEERLLAWGKVLPKPLDLARFIDVLAPHFRTKDLRVLIGRLVSLVLLEWDAIDCRGLTFCCRVLRRERAFIEDGDDGEFGGWVEFVEKLERDGLGKVLERPASSRNKLALIEELWRTHDDRAHDALAKHADRLVPKEPPYDVQDYALAIRLIEIKNNLTASRKNPPWERVLDHAMARCQNLARWEIPSEPPPFADQLLLRSALRQALEIDDGDWREVARGIRQELMSSIERSTLAQLSVGLNALANVNRPFAVRLLDTISVSWLGGLLAGRPFGVGEIATLLGTFTRLHAQSAYGILYGSSGLPKAQLVKELGKRIHETGDAKGAGRILYAARKIDELFGTLKSGFAEKLSREIGTDFLEFILRRERRISVLFHLIQGFTASDVALSEKAQGIVRDVIADAIEGTARPWAPQLALLLCDLEPIGARFAEGLVKRIDRGAILFGMTAAQNVEALESFHRLGRLYKGGSEETGSTDKTLAREFREKYREGMSIPRLSRADRPDVVLRAIKAVGETLRRAGVGEAAREMLAEAFQGNTGEKGAAAVPDRDRPRAGRRFQIAALRNSSSGDVATTIRLWQQIDPVSVGEIVRWDATQNILLHKLRRTITEPHVGVDLIKAVTQADPPSGEALLKSFRSRPGAWRSFLHELAHDQNPVTQCTALLQLCEVSPDAADPPLRSTLYEKVWRSRIDQITSPRAIASLLKLFAAWDEQWGIEAAASIDTTRLVRRLRQGCTADLESAAGLIGTLQALGQTEHARELALALKSVPDVNHRASLDAWQILLPVISAMEPDWGHELSLDLSRRAASAAASPFILDEERFWRTFGWLAYSCRQSAGDRGAVQLGGKPPSFDVIADPGVRLWATVWLADAPWVLGARTSAARELLSEPDTKRLGIPAIVALARFGQLGGQVDWGRVARRPPTLSASALGVVLRASHTDAALADWTSDHSDDIRREIDKPYHRGDFFVQEAKTLLRVTDRVAVLRSA
jgi:hypothetical protein